MVPAVLQDRTIEASLLPDVPARLLDRSARAGGHVFGLERLDYDGAKAVRQRRSGLVVPMFPRAGRVGLGGCGSAAGLGVALRSTLAARGLLLRFPVAPIENPKALDGDGRKFAGRKGDGVGNTAVDPDSRAAVRRGVVFDFLGERDVPAQRVERDSNVLELPQHRPRVAETDPADLRKARGTPAAIEALGFDLAALETEAFVDATAARRWVTGDAGEEIVECLVEIPNISIKF